VATLQGHSAAYRSWGTKEMSTLTTNSLVRHAQLRLFNSNWLSNSALLQHHEQKPGKSPEDWKFSSSLLPTFTHLPPKWNGLLSTNPLKCQKVSGCSDYSSLCSRCWVGARTCKQDLGKWQVWMR
jgi:hypothetical protein